MFGIAAATFCATSESNFEPVCAALRSKYLEMDLASAPLPDDLVPVDFVLAAGLPVERRKGKARD